MIVITDNLVTVVTPPGPGDSPGAVCYDDSTVYQVGDMSHEETWLLRLLL